MSMKMNCTMVVCCHDEWRDYNADTVLKRFLKRMKQTVFVDNYAVCSNVDALVPLVLEEGFQHIPMGLPAQRQGAELPSDFRKQLSGELKTLFGTVGNVQISIDAAHILLRSETLEDMFDLLMEEGRCNEVSLVNTIDPHLYMKDGESIHQIFDHAHVDRQKMPALYRRSSVAIRHGLRPQLGPKVVEVYSVPWTETMNYSPKYHDFFEEQSKALEVVS